MCAKIAVVTVQPIVAWCRAAMSSPMPNTVASRPSGTPRIAASTSWGEGVAIVPPPRRARIASGMGFTFGRCG
ncbi:hypothetical protein [Variovorax rhizosphaerae]|uniref:Secreted protein n=1 Tax=Variovorax rhizosphaerae TaxID=1836200 RepID=A0ABU8WQX2_9BURK